MKFHIYCDERYPVYGLATVPSKWDRLIEISDDLHAEIVAAEAAYDAMQRRLEAFAKQQNGPTEPTEPAPERITQADIDAIQKMAVESEESIQAALEAFNLRMERVA